uniref:Jerky putative n=1 Tax=Albugo laibachii Nc14 TaxID=890382 RepID=F0WVB2_9STRA|nr:jerky putative [Albugo laibachii Nc14]|eukprot:CCA25351.1 jerky putative [Albugo laibachii Nc14]
MTAATRIRLNSEQKRVLREHHAAHPEMTRQELSKWAASAFKLPRPLARTSLTDLLKRQKDDTECNPLRKASHCAHSPDLEAQLVLWINRCEELKIPIVTGAAIRHKAEIIRSILLNKATPTTPTVLYKLMFSKGWLYRFQQWQGLKSRRTHGEAGLVKTTAIENGRRVLQAVTSLYDKKDIYNMDETAYFYCSIPDKTISKNRIPGRKKIKKHLTVAVTSNADVSTKIPLLFVGKARQPLCFGVKSAEELGIQYANAAKGWMNTELFTSWIERFNERMKSEGRHVQFPVTSGQSLLLSR